MRETQPHSTHSHLVASDRPRLVIESLPRRPSQPATMRQYQDGFENYFNTMPTLNPDDPLLTLKSEMAGEVMKSLARAVTKDGTLLTTPPPGKFSRVILGVESPREGHEGSEILVAQWGKGFRSPVHGHAPGLLHEEILSGQMMVHTYKHLARDVVRPLRSDIAGPGTLVSKFSPPDTRGERMGLIHNFVAVAPSVSLHFVPEHTRDGRDNRFRVEHFKDFRWESFRQLERSEAMMLQPGSVALVRSSNVPEYGDHWIVVTGPLVLKPHGLRPMETAVQTGYEGSTVLNQFTPDNTGLTILKADAATTERFLDFHEVTVSGRDVRFPEA